MTDDIKELAAALDDVDLNYESARDIQENLDEDRAEQIAFRKLVHSIGEPPGADLGPVEAAFKTVEHVNLMSQRLAELEDAFDKLQRDVDTALTLAEQQAEDGDTTKQRAAYLKTRDELVRRCAKDRTMKGASITVSEVQQMLKPELKVYHQTVQDAWGELESEWSAFTTGQREDGTKALKVEQDGLDPALVRAVESNLERDDLTKRLLSRSSEEGA